LFKILKAILIVHFFSTFLSIQLSWASGSTSVCSRQQSAEGCSLLPSQSPASCLLEEH